MLKCASPDRISKTDDGACDASHCRIPTVFTLHPTVTIRHKTALPYDTSAAFNTYIEGILDKDEFAARKEQYVNRKAELADSVARFETGGASRLEPLISFITDSRQARYVAESESLADLRKWHNLVGSNLLFASEVIQSDVSCEALAKREGVSMSETVTAHAVRVGEKSQEPDGAAVRSMDGSRGGPAARSPCRQPTSPRLRRSRDFGGQAALSPEIEKRGENLKNSNWRRGWDSNPRCLAALRFSRPVQ